MSKNTTDELREQLVMEISELRATACNAYQRFHGQEEGEDPVMDRYWKQERKAEEKLYLAIEQLISNREKLAYRSGYAAGNAKKNYRKKVDAETFEQLKTEITADVLAMLRKAGL